MECFKNGLCEKDFNGKCCKYYTQNKYGKNDCKRRYINKDHVRSRQTFNIKRQILDLLEEIESDYGINNETKDSVTFDKEDFKRWEKKSRSGFKQYFETNYPGTQIPIIENLVQFFELFKYLFLAKYSQDGWFVHYDGWYFLEFYNTPRYEANQKRKENEKLIKEQIEREKLINKINWYQPESQIQKEFIDGLFERYGATCDKGPPGGQKGVPDLFISYPAPNESTKGWIEKVELKVPDKGKVSEFQKDRYKLDKLNGIPSYILATKEDYKNYFEEKDKIYKQ